LFRNRSIKRQHRNVDTGEASMRLRGPVLGGGRWLAIRPPG
jgi:hypothetical protein